MDLTFRCDYDAPFDKIEIGFRFNKGYPATGQTWDSGGEPGAPDDVEVLHAIVTVDGKRHDAPDWLAEALGKLFDDDLIAMGREEVAEACSYGRAA